MVVIKGEKGWADAELPFTGAVSSFISGETNPDRITIRYFKSNQNSDLFARILFGPHTAGQLHHVHTGVQTAVLDEFCCALVWQAGYRAVVASLETHFIQLVPLNEILTLSGTIVEYAGHQMKAEGLISNEREQILTKASVQFIELSEESGFDDSILRTKP